MDLNEVIQVASEKLNEIAECFKPGVKLTLVARTPGNDDADFMLTNDDPAESIKAIQRRIGAGSGG